MTYEIETKDGIVIRGIPDDIPQDHPSIKSKVSSARAQRDGSSAIEGMSGAEKFLAGVGKGMTDVGRGVSQVLGFGDQAAIDDARSRDAALVGTGSGLAGDIVGNLAVTALPGMGIGGLAAKGATMLPRAISAIAPTIAAAATGGTVSALTTPIESGGSRTSAASLGAVGGAVGDVAARGLARVAQPIMQSEPVKTLLSKGIVPTPGQAIGQRTLAGTTEQKLESLPLVGQIIQNAKQRAVGELNIAQLKSSVPASDAAKITTIGRAGIQQADEILSKGYDEVLDAIGNVPQTFVIQAKPATVGPFNPKTGGYPKIPATKQSFSGRINAIANDVDLALSDEAKGKLLNIVKLQFSRPGIDKNTGEMSADLAKQIDSTIGRLAREHSSSLSADDRSLGLALRAVQGDWRDTIAKSSPTKEIAERLSDLNKSYANFVRTERAASYVGARDGLFSPSQLQSSVKASDRSVRAGRFAKGHALGQGLSDPALSVLGNTVANSGTADRALLNLLLLSGGGVAANDYLGGPAYLSALALAPLMYSRAGSRYMVGDLVPGQQSLASLLRSSAPLAAQAGRAYQQTK